MLETIVYHNNNFKKLKPFHDKTYFITKQSLEEKLKKEIMPLQKEIDSKYLIIAGYAFFNTMFYNYYDRFANSQEPIKTFYITLLLSSALISQIRVAYLLSKIKKLKKRMGEIYDFLGKSF